MHSVVQGFDLILHCYQPKSRVQSLTSQGVNDTYLSLVFPLSGTKCMFVKRLYNLGLMLFVATEAGELFVFEVLGSFYLVHFF